MRPRNLMLLFIALATSACSANRKDTAPSAAGDDGGSADGGAADGASDGAADGASDGGGADGGPVATNGTAPDAPLPAPDFTATNRDGAARDREDLLGQPTAMWFFPAATTAG